MRTAVCKETADDVDARARSFVGWAKRSVPTEQSTALPRWARRARARICPPYICDHQPKHSPMKPPPFCYHDPKTVAEVVGLLSTLENAKLLAGGQSLMPMLNFRY